MRKVEQRMKEWLSRPLFKKGWKKLKQINGESPTTVVEQLSETAPDLARLIVEFGYGEILSQKPLSLKEKELVSIALLASQNSPQLRIHIRAGLHVGLTPKEIVSCLTQVALFCGFPTAIESMRVAQRVFESEGA